MLSIKAKAKEEAARHMAELQPQPQMKMTIRALIPSPKRPIQGNKDPSRGYGPVLGKASSPRVCNTSVNMHPGGILVSALLQVHAAILLTFLVETHTLAAWNRCLLLPESTNRSGADGARALRWNDARHNRELLMRFFMSELAPVKHVATNTRKLTEQE
ncbi:hypothetical protein DPX16_3917 [Anabarilius grahami]|uniref:Uncharacterized protein n=1 Tax=Anabarilius grahami TaxID=495550 RepID=A0A3N0XKC4_ANAGA|nr:hypothetical protein DPX16_3917 [Anabarilius grahami]